MKTRLKEKVLEMIVQLIKSVTSYKKWPWLEVPQPDPFRGKSGIRIDPNAPEINKLRSD